MDDDMAELHTADNFQARRHMGTRGLLLLHCGRSGESITITRSDARHLLAWLAEELDDLAEGDWVTFGGAAYKVAHVLRDGRMVLEGAQHDTIATPGEVSVADY